MPFPQPNSPLDTIPGLEDASKEQKKIEERLAKTYLPKVTQILIKQRKQALAMKNKLLFR